MLTLSPYAYDELIRARRHDLTLAAHAHFLGRDAHRCSPKRLPCSQRLGWLLVDIGLRLSLSRRTTQGEPTSWER